MKDKLIINSQKRIELFTNSKLKVDKIGLEMLKHVTGIKCIKEPIIALPDMHYKEGEKSPTGIVVVTDNTIIPEIVNPTCGMSLIKTNLVADDLSYNDISEIFNCFKKYISPKIRVKATISNKDVVEILKGGMKWAERKYDLKENELKGIEDRGNMFDDKDIDTKFIPKEAIKMGKYSLGVLGLGNHFIELHKVDKLINKNLAKKFGFKKNQLVIIIHSGAGSVGSSIYKYYLDNNLLYKTYLVLGFIPYAKKVLYKLNKMKERVKQKYYYKRARLINFMTFDLNSKKGRNFLYGLYAGTNYGFVNRFILYKLVENSFKEIKEDALLSLFCDNVHESLQIETINHKKLLVHRKGATRINIDQPVLIPEFMGGRVYLCVGDKNCKDTFYSVNHGTGRLIPKTKARKMFKLSNMLKDLKKNKIQIHRYGEGRLEEEAPGSFKSVKDVIGVIEGNKIVKPVLTFKSLAVLKGD